MISPTTSPENNKCCGENTDCVLKEVLWFKFIYGVFWTGFNFIVIVPDYDNKYMTKEDKNWTSLKNFAPKLNSTHNRNISLNESK